VEADAESFLKSVEYILMAFKERNFKHEARCFHAKKASSTAMYEWWQMIGGKLVV
jgi:hypothetical protein